MHCLTNKYSPNGPQQPAVHQSEELATVELGHAVMHLIQNITALQNLLEFFHLQDNRNKGLCV